MAMADGIERPALTWPGTGDALVWAADGEPDAELPGTSVTVRWSVVFGKWVAEEYFSDPGLLANTPQIALNELHEFIVERTAHDRTLLRVQQKGSP